MKGVLFNHHHLLSSFVGAKIRPWLCLFTCQGADDADHGRDSGHRVGEEEDGDGDHDHPGEQDGLQTLAEDGQVLVSVQEVIVENIRPHIFSATRTVRFGIVLYYGNYFYLNL